MDSPISYTWRIPSMSDDTKHSLCCGYIRNNYNGYMIYSLIKLFCAYYSNDPFTINDLKTAKYKQCFDTDLVSIKSFKWLLCIYPKGYNAANNGKYVIILRVTSLPQQVSKISFKFTLTIKETDDKVTKQRQFTANRRFTTAPFTNINLNELKTFTVELEISNFKIYTQDNILFNDEDNLYDSQTIPTPLPSWNFKWSISDIITINAIKMCSKKRGPSSSIFSYGPINLALTFIPNHGDDQSVLFIRFVSCNDPISKIAIRCILILQELNIMFKTNQFILSNGGNMSGWSKSTLSKQQLNELNSLTFYAIFTIYEAYNEQHQVIPNYLEQLAINNTKLIISPIMKYKWTIPAIEVINEYSEGAISPIFMYYGFKWCLRFIAIKNGSTVLSIKWIKPPPNISKILLNVKVILIETGSVYYQIGVTLKRDNRTHRWPNTLLPTNRLKQFDSFTFDVELTVYQIYDQQNNIIKEYESTLKYASLPYNPSNMELPIIRYNWNILPAEMNIIKRSNVGMRYNSKIITFGSFRWVVVLYPKHKKNNGNISIFIMLLEFPSIFSEASFKYTLKINQMNFKHSVIKYMKCTQNNMVISHAINTCIPFETLQKFNQLTISTEMTVLDLYDKTGNIISDHSDCIENYEFIEMNELEFPSAEYQWVVSKELLKEIKYAPNVYVFTSEIFEAHSLKWCIDLYPNGAVKRKKSSIGIYVRLLSLESKLRIQAKFTLHLIELNEKHEFIFWPNIKGTAVGYPSSYSSTKDLMYLESLTITVKIQLIDVWNKQQRLTSKFVNNLRQNEINCNHFIAAQEKYEWKINDEMLLTKMKNAEIGESFNSSIFKMHSFNFRLVIHPNGRNKEEKGLTNIRMELISNLPSKSAIIYTRCKLNVIEANKKVTIPGIFYDKQLNKDWNFKYGVNRLSMNEFNQLSQCTIVLEMEMIEVYDENIGNITMRYIDSDKMRLKTWLQKDVGLQEYYYSFIENGFDTLSMIKLISINELNMIGMVKPEHRARIMLAIASLNISTYS